jgi:hypothetical protein
MKSAQASDGQPLPAGKNAPPTAICPHCGGVVSLRRRKLMNSADFAYYWRHAANANRDCTGRSRRS